MRGQGLALVAFMTLVVTACTGHVEALPKPDETSTAASASLGAEPRVLEGLEIGDLVPRGKVTAESTGLVTPGGGGELSVKLDDGSKATLNIPRDAVGEEIIVTLKAFRSGDVLGLAMEPDGLWLQRPAHLVIPGAVRLLTRIGAASNGDLYREAAVTAPTPIVRLRPVITDDSSVLATVLPMPASGAVRPNGTGDIPPVDPSDAAAAAAEEDAAAEGGASPEGGDTDVEAAQAVAAAWLPALETRCSDPKDPAHARMAATRLTAGAQAPSSLPECMTRVVEVYAHSEIDWSLDEKIFTDASEHVSGLTEVKSDVGDVILPLQGEITGVDASTSWFLSTFLYGMDQVAGGMFGAQEPTGDRCGTTPLQNGRLAATLAVEGETLRLTLDPVSGFYTTSCGGKPMDSDVLTWTVIRLLKGMGDARPFEFVFPRDGMSSNVFSQLGNKSERKGKLNANGDYVVETREVRLSAGMVVNLFESMKDYEDRTQASASPSSTPSGQG